MDKDNLDKNNSLLNVLLIEDSDTDAFMYHCHILEHEDAGMMGQFLVTR